MTSTTLSIGAVMDSFTSTTGDATPVSENNHPGGGALPSLGLMVLSLLGLLRGRRKSAAG
jgi:hypothetical protein